MPSVPSGIAGVFDAGREGPVRGEPRHRTIAGAESPIAKVGGDVHAHAVLNPVLGAVSVTLPVVNQPPSAGIDNRRGVPILNAEAQWSFNV